MKRMFLVVLCTMLLVGCGSKKECEVCKPCEEPKCPEGSLTSDFYEIDKTKLATNFDGTSGYIYREISDSELGGKINLNLEGKLEICYNDEKKCNLLTDMKVKDAIYYGYETLYFLGEDNNVYSVFLDKKTNEVKKETENGNIARMFKYTYCPLENAGCETIMYVKTNKNEILSIKDA